MRHRSASHAKSRKPDNSTGVTERFYGNKIADVDFVSRKPFGSNARLTTVELNSAGAWRKEDNIVNVLIIRYIILSCYSKLLLKLLFAVMY